MKFSKSIIWTLVLMIFTACASSEGLTASVQPVEKEMETIQQDTTKKEWAIVIHGGAGAISKDKPDSVKQAYLNDLDEALSVGEEILRNGGSSLDAVESVINYLEDNPRFNAGKGAVYTHEGKHELDAAIMVGNTRKAGTITGVTTVKNPISLARLVMERSKHVMFSGQGAEEFADKVDVERVPNSYFDTEARYKSLQRVLEREKNDNEQASLLKPKNNKDKFGTVGCVALDKDGMLVAGTSTGGMTNKMYGRVGDVPIIGSGTYASDVVAVSMTGWGEKIMQAVSGHTVSSYMKFKPATLEEAGNYLLGNVLNPGEAGMIAVDKYGNMFMKTNTLGMYRAKSDSEGNREVAIWSESDIH